MSSFWDPGLFDYGLESFFNIVFDIIAADRRSQFSQLEILN